MSVVITRTAFVDDDGSGTSGTVINNAVKTELYNQIDAALAAVGAAALPLAGGVISGTLKVGSGAYVSTSADMGQVFNGAAVNGFLSEDTRSTAGTDQTVVFARNGAIVGAITTTLSATTYNTSSDARLKRDRGVATDPAILRQLVVHDFDWLIDDTPDRGVFAQEAHRIKPQAIAMGTDERRADGTLVQPWQADYSKYVPDLIVGWQAHEARLLALEARIAQAA